MLTGNGCCLEPRRSLCRLCGMLSASAGMQAAVHRMSPSIHVMPVHKAPNNGPRVDLEKTLSTTCNPATVLADPAVPMHMGPGQFTDADPVVHACMRSILLHLHDCILTLAGLSAIVTILRRSEVVIGLHNNVPCLLE